MYQISICAVVMPRACHYRQPFRQCKDIYIYIYRCIYGIAGTYQDSGERVCVCVVVVWLFIGTQNRLVALHSALFPRLT
jgi:hypothetical protein